MESITVPKILVITVASWNSSVGSNTWTSLLDDYPHNRIANICIREEMPNNDVCSNYFVISESRIIKSLLNRSIQTGYRIKIYEKDRYDKTVQRRKRFYSHFSHRRSYGFLMVRELIWKLGKWQSKELDQFIDEFQPDVVLYSMEGYIHLNRIVEYIIEKTKAKALGYFWDDNFSYKQSKRLGFKIYRFFQRKSLFRLVKLMDGFFAISDKTKKEADSLFHIDCQVLTKPIYRIPTVNYSAINYPIKILYTGNLLSGRDTSLIKLVKVIKELGKGLFCVDVFTQTTLSHRILRKIDNDICSIHAPIPQSDVLKMQRDADILLFLEDTNGPYANVARLSFSTKITDYLSSGKCILAIGNKLIAPMQYFIDNSAALVAETEEEIAQRLHDVLSDTSLMSKYASLGAKLGMKNHNPAVIKSIFELKIKSIISKNAITSNENIN